MTEGIGDPRLSAEGELALARMALDEADFGHAADHVAGALAHAPTMPEVHEVLAKLAARTGGALDLYPLADHVFIGAVVARGHLLAAAGQPGEALELLAAATGHAPNADWAGVPWVADPELASRIEPDQLARTIMQVCAGVPDPVPDEQRGPLQPYLRVAKHAAAAHPRHALLLGAASALARRMGETAIAIEWAQRGVRVAPTKLGEVWLGYAFRSAGRTKESIAALRRAVAHDPADLSVYADIAGTLADSGQLDEAIRWIDDALARDAEFDCAVHTAHRLRYRRDGRLSHLVALADFQRHHPDDSHEHTDLAECCQDRPWLGRLPAAGEAVINVLRQMLETEGPITGGRLRLSNLEPPSAMRTVGAALPDMAVIVERVPEPDLRLPRRTGGRSVWEFFETDALPALREPSEAAVERIRQVALPAWPHPQAAYDAAVSLALLEMDDLLALLVHPPAPPATELGAALAAHDPSLWVRSVQVWACLGLLHHRTDEPWESSTRRRVLVDLAWGVEDWITEAALFALVTAAWVTPELRADVAGLVRDRLADIAVVVRQRPVTIAWSVAQLALATPELDAKTELMARTIIAAERPAEETPAPPPPRRTGFLRRLFRR
ncbi:hypothetical protein JCM9533A_75760 [Catenuloplanes niger JCM 9533]|uniref:Tetratricopeptide (TPR) repeat protein n=2 Tax=Micromonosporaceae TaxID=28056 RepID=A0AAE4CX60_9ACTN|nr:tetratricopeptide (TPR) repeat protein [Catenuloplanes niger]